MGEKAFIFVQDKTSEPQLFDQASVFSNMLKKYEKRAQFNVLEPTL